MLRIITLNLNGIRSAWRKGAHQWLAAQSADVVCLQELKAQLPDLSEDMRQPEGFRAFYHCAEKKGYSGVGLWCREEPDDVVEGIGEREFDAEGRYLRADFGNLSVISLYVPSGSSSPERQEAKFRFLDLLLPHLVALRASGRSNQKNSGFLPEERAWVGRALEAGWVDAFRKLHPEATETAYTWWSNRGQAWAKNVGWRLDYQLVTPSLAEKAVEARVFKEQRFSDHAPLSIDYSL